MKGTFTTTMIGVALALCASGVARADQSARRYDMATERLYDAKLERWMMERAAERLGGLRGSLKEEWRPATQFDRFVTMGGRELSLMMHHAASGPTTASVIEPEFGRQRPEAAAPARPFIESPNRASRVIPLYAKADG